MAYPKEEISELLFVRFEKFKEMFIKKYPDLLRHEEEIKIIINFIEHIGI